MGVKYLSNPFREGKGHDCFGCAPDRETGLRLRFAEEDGGRVVCRWTPDVRWQGWDGVLHGGIATTVLDETAGWAVLRRYQRAAMTTRIEVKFLHPAPATGVELVATAWFTGRVNEKIVSLHATLADAEGTVCAEADADYYVMDEERSRAMGFTSCEAVED